MIHPPRPARWFQLVAHPGEMPAALAALAEHADVQLESALPELSGNRELGVMLDFFHRLEERFSAYWPAPATPPGNHHGLSVNEAMAGGLASLETWRQEAEPFLSRLQKAQAELWDLLLLEDLASHLTGGVLDFSLWREEGEGTVRSALFVLPADDFSPPEVGPVLLTPVTGQHHLFLLVAGESQAVALFRERVLQGKGRGLPIPKWMRCSPMEGLEKIRQRRLRTEKKLAGLQIDLTRLADTHHLAAVLAVIHRLRWYHQQAKPVAGTHLTHITGWTVADHAETLNRRMQECGVRALAGLPPPPSLEAPMILDNPWWAKPFQIFPAMLGVPGRHEVDPSQILALLMPLLFGFMFGDVGQGPLLAAAGYWIARRMGLDLGWLLVAGGLSATVFGLLFGSLFCLEGILPALWLHPLAHPMTLLAVPLGLGVVIVSGGVLLEGVQAHWRREGRRWLWHGLAMLLVYWGALGLFFTPWALVAVAAGGLAVLTGGALHHGAMGVALALGHIPETLMQMAVNTLSFSRVGAFALAHAGLSQAVVTLAELAGSGPGWLLVLILGNAVILLLEGLVVSVQTTRLVLFEFFIRFLKGEGRPFVPTPPPPEAASAV